MLPFEVPMSTLQSGHEMHCHLLLTAQYKLKRSRHPANPKKHCFDSDHAPLYNSVISATDSPRRQLREMTKRVSDKEITRQSAVIGGEHGQWQPGWGVWAWRGWCGAHSGQWRVGVGRPVVGEGSFSERRVGGAKAAILPEPPGHGHSEDGSTCTSRKPSIFFLSLFL